VSSFNKFFDEKGNITLGILAIALAGGMGLLFFKSKSSILDSATTVIKDEIQLLEFHSAVETFKLSYFDAEVNYYAQVARANCDSPHSFISALKNGSGCSNPSEGIKVFQKQPGEDSNLVSFHGGCLIKEKSTKCGEEKLNMSDINMNPVKVVSVKKKSANSKIGVISHNSFDFYLFSLLPEKNYSEVVVLIRTKNLKGKDLGSIKKTFAIKSFVTNFAHTEADGLITQENPSPQSRCQGAPWAAINIFNPITLTCNPFTKLGGGTGLAYHKGRFFGFRPDSGQVIDLFAAITTDSSTISEDGILDDKNIFPPYRTINLMNADDITTVGESIYYVKGMGLNAHIGKASADSAKENEVVCPLGELGWGLAFSGIAAHSSSMDVGDLTKEGLAIFYIKSESGDLLTAYVEVDPSKQPSEVRKCYVIKDNKIQDIEYKRTYGFDRTEEEPRVIYY
jgi:hypothetical protein